MRRLIVLGALTALAACSSGHAAIQATPTPTLSQASPSSTPSPRSTTLTLAQAKSRYLVIVKPSNDAVDAFNRALSKNRGLRELRLAAAVLATRERSFSSLLLSTSWPPSVAPTAAKLAEAMAEDSALIRQASRAASRTDFVGAVQQSMNNTDASKFSNLMRIELGLPPASA